MTIDYTLPPARPGEPPQQPSAKRTCGAIALAGCAVVLVVLAAVAAGLVWFVFHIVKSTDVYRMAVAKAQADPEVIAMLGAPVEDSWWVTGSVNIKNETGSAHMTIPLHGPKGEARLRVLATMNRDEWTFSDLTVRSTSGGAAIDLLRNRERESHDESQPQDEPQPRNDER